MCKYELLKAFEGYHLIDTRQTYKNKIIYNTALQVVKKGSNSQSLVFAYDNTGTHK